MVTTRRILGFCLSLTSAVTWAQNAAPIRLNTLGYLPDTPKHASIAAPAGTSFTIVRGSDRAVAFTGTVGAARQNLDTAEDLGVADFSGLTEEGHYRLQLATGETSASFAISRDIYREPLQLITRAMYLWRCGMAVDGEWQGNRFHQNACHTDDAWLDHVTGEHDRLPTVGGWHDAGDYNKYVVNAGVTVGAMLRAWEDFPALRHLTLNLPESGGALPDYLAEIKYEIDWLLTMQAEDGRVYTKISTERFGPFIPPDQEKTPRFVCPWGSPATADFVAMLAQSARAFRPFLPDYADRCLAAARKSHAFLVAHPEHHEPDQTKFRTGPYRTQDVDDRLWAAAELWESTGDAAVLKELEARIRQLTPVFDEDWDWGAVKNLGLLTYVASQRNGRSAELLGRVRAELLKVAGVLVTKARAHGYARPLDKYYWGCNGGVARQTLLLMSAYRLERNEAFRTTALDAVNHLLGRNVHARSYVTGLGANPPNAPHDRRSGSDRVDAPWPGYLVGGPHPAARDWHDVEPDARTNEIAINWNAALIYALAAFVE